MVEAIEEKVLGILSQNVSDGHTGLSLNTNLEEAGVDSLGMVEIIFELEEAFDIQVPDPEDINEQFRDFNTPADVIRLVESLIQKKEKV